MIVHYGAFVMLPVDSHVHSEWSWDAPNASMENACARAVELGLPAIAFTEHLDHTSLNIGSADDAHLLSLSSPEGVLSPPAFDVDGYLDSIERCRERFPGLRILSGLEVGEPHWHAEAVAKVLAAGRFDRILGSLHCLPDGDGFAEPWGLYDHRLAAEVIREYLAEVAGLAAGSDVFSVLAHIDYPVRSWPTEAGPFDPPAFEEEFRHALRATASSGRALEINTRLPLSPVILRWWHEEGGPAVSFGSDAHDPSLVAHRFREAADMAEAHGFRPGQDPYDFWARVD
ncbi:PHP domain-containing protein [Sphaerisporangium sp. NPDC005289]|uniref:PHP domain-containing protein n=1 Tax=Sphaerisporangium sp. NPDC005289 TaxID=3155247 RepID=UPI0033ACD8E3